MTTILNNLIKMQNFSCIQRSYTRRKDEENCEHARPPRRTRSSISASINQDFDLIIIRFLYFVLMNISYMKCLVLSLIL